MFEQVLQKSKAAAVVVSQEVVTLYFQISFKRGPESKCSGIFSSKILWVNLRFPKYDTVSYGYFLIVTQSDVNDSSTLFFSNVLHNQLIFITLGISTFFPSVPTSINGS